MPELDDYVEQNPSNSVFAGTVPPTPGAIADQLHVARWDGDTAEETRYALLVDGTVWTWEYSPSGLSGFIGDVFVGVVVGVMLAVVVIAAIWVVVGVIALGRALHRAA
ncbi:MAG: hypothetical protein M1565_00025 [Actinobacteria bacterium]|nr:hypothetical protein [Actinomycetota bacterium]